MGLLELLWITCQKNAKAGDIGKFSNVDIAIECDWQGDPNELVSALVDCNWLDRCPVHRLVVHNWRKHCPGYIHAWIKSQNTAFAEATAEETAEATAEATAQTTTDDPIPNVTNSNPTQPDQTKEPGKPAVSIEDQLARIQDSKLREAFRDWVGYKAERRQAYKPRGLKQAVTHVLDLCTVYGAEAVAANLRRCMAVNYAGFGFGLGDRPPTNPGRPSTMNAADAAEKYLAMRSQTNG